MNAGSLNNHVWLVIPAFNEASIVRSVVNDALELFANVVVVDDGSADSTEEEISKTSAWCLKHPINLGQGAALMTGIEFAYSRGAKFIASFDADGQHSPTDVVRMYNMMEASGSLDVVLGSRFMDCTNSIPKTKRFFLKLAVFYMRLATGVPLSDAHNGLRLFTRKAIEKLKFRQNGMSHASEIIELISKFKMRYAECGVTIRYTDYSISKGQPMSNSLSIIVNSFLDKILK